MQIYFTFLSLLSLVQSFPSCLRRSSHFFLWTPTVPFKFVHVCVRMCSCMCAICHSTTTICLQACLLLGYSFMSGGWSMVGTNKSVYEIMRERKKNIKRWKYHPHLYPFHSLFLCLSQEFRDCIVRILEQRRTLGLPFLFSVWISPLLLHRLIKIDLYYMIFV